MMKVDVCCVRLCFLFTALLSSAGMAWHPINIAVAGSNRKRLFHWNWVIHTFQLQIMPTRQLQMKVRWRDGMEWNTSLQQNTPAPTHSQAAAHAFSSIKSIGMPIDCSFFFIKHKAESGNYSKIIGFLPSQFSIHTNNSNSSSINQDTCAHANVWVGL